ncbi:MAG: enoyl-CoA hydratase/isomerase family protein [Rhodocyclaceae bacterium]|nr:enoyl-CoA hydratase/isomerase family protein [Rhodocyclaceae bacterium]
MSTLHLSVDAHIGTVTLNKPPANALDRRTYLEFKELFEAINTRDDIWVVLFKAEGKHFSTGNDVNEFLGLTNNEQAQAYGQDVSNAVAAVLNCRVPVVAAVNGNALGAGSNCFLLRCDRGGRQCALWIA